jgi:hypothetical protein
VNTGTFELEVDLSNKQDVLSGGSNITVNVGRGDVYFENNSYDNTDGAGLTLRTNDNPNNGSIFAVRSTGHASRLWVGQTITTPGTSPFYCGFTGSNGEENDTTKYKHSLTDAIVSLGTPVTCSSNLTVNGSLIGGLTANGGSGNNVLNSIVGDGKVANIFGVSPVSVATVFDPAGVNPDHGNLQITLDTSKVYFAAGRIASSGSALSSKGSVSFTSTRTATGQYTITFASAHPDGADYVVQLTPKRTSEAGGNDDIEVVYNSTTSTTLLVQTRHHDDGGSPGSLVNNEFCFLVL